MRRIYVSIPEATDIKYVIISQLRGYLLVNRLAKADCQAPVLRLERVHPKILAWLRGQYRHQCAEKAHGIAGGGADV